MHKILIVGEHDGKLALQIPGWNISQIEQLLVVWSIVVFFHLLPRIL